MENLQRIVDPFKSFLRRILKRNQEQIHHQIEEMFFALNH